MIKKENLRLGQQIYFRFKNQVKSGTIIELRIDSVLIKGRGFTQQLPYYLIYESENMVSKIHPLIKSNLTKSRSIPKLNNLLNKVLQDYDIIFKRDGKLKNIKLVWGTRYTYHEASSYDRQTNVIKISKSLLKSPSYVIEFIIFEELLKIKYKKSNKYVKFNEIKFKRADKAKEYLDILFSDIRFLNKKITRLIE